jgi:hypothetical protein
MTLIEAVTKLASKSLKGENSWYVWEIDRNKIPKGVTITIGSQYSENLKLKYELHKLFKMGDKKMNAELIEYFIKTWGKIKGNKPETMENYKNETHPKKLIEKGVKGVASWSKALTIHDPDKYAIFDARVSVSLNCLQIINSTTSKLLFPLLPSQNNKIKHTNKLLKGNCMKRWDLAQNNCFYLQYIGLLKAVAKEVKSNIVTIEMLLFAKAEDLAKSAFPNVNWQAISDKKQG